MHEIRKQNACIAGGGAFYHWRSAGGAEVDLLLERDGRFYPFEIKLTANPKRRDIAGLMSFRQSYPKIPIEKAAVLCAADRPYWISEDVAALPWNHL